MVRDWIGAPSASGGAIPSPVASRKGGLDWLVSESWAIPVGFDAALAEVAAPGQHGDQLACVYGVDCAVLIRARSGRRAR